MSTPSPGWNPDPTGRHEYRYWDGDDWTDDVSDDGVTAVDPLDVAAPPGGEPTAPFDPTQQYTPPGQADPYGAPSGGYAPQPGPQDYGQPPGIGGPGGYGSGPMPPGQPAKAGPNIPLIVGGVVVALLVVVAGLVVLLSGDDGGDDDDVAGGSTTTTTQGGVTTTTLEEDPTTTSSTTSTTTGGSTGTTLLDVFALEAGDCYLDPETEGGLQELPGVPCSEPHDKEVFHVHVIDATDRPSDQEMVTLVEEECYPAFASYVGVGYYSSALYIDRLVPSENSWANGDRELVCILYEPDTQLTGSAQGTNR